ncbi:MAG: hypothetical protein IJJ26_07190 [Victivallales bacterium]|nr:hypothetical protein [Victivallales bacterium]
MKPWPKCHKNLAGIAFLLFVACVILAVVRLRPAWNTYQETREERESLEAKLKASRWPKDSARLNALLQEYDKKLKKDTGSGVGLIQQTDEVLKKATSLFLPRITGEYGSVADFMQKASQTEYKDQFDRLDNYLLGKQIQLDPVVYGLNESTSEPYKYQMLLKLWTTQAVVDCALQSGLKVVHKRNPNGPQISAQIVAMPMRPYILSVNNETPYLMEFPVQLEVRGSMANVSKFIDSLSSDGRFLPMVKMELSVQSPGWGKKPAKPDRDGHIRTHQVTARVVCSSFFIPAGEGRKVEKSSNVPSLPRGA